MQRSLVPFAAPVLSLLLALAGAVPLHAAPVTIEGRVLRADDDAPVSGAPVTLAAIETLHQSQARLLAGAPEPPPQARTKTGADGSFSLSAPAPGLWRVRVEPPGDAPREIDLAPLVEDVELPALELEPTSPLVVLVSAGESGHPLAGAEVTARLARPRATVWPFADWEPAPVRQTSGKDGRAVLRWPRDVDAELLVSAPGRAGVSREIAPGAPAKMVLHAGEERRLRVLDGAGRPAAGVLALLGKEHRPAGTSDATGELVLRVAAGNEPALELLAADGRVARGTLRRLLAPPVAAAAGAPAGATAPSLPAPQEVRLADLDALAGRVIDDVDRRPLGGAILWVDGWRWTRADGSGAFRILVPPATATSIGVGAAAHFTDRVEIEQDAGGFPRPPVIPLEPAVAVRGTVVDGDGSPLAGVRIQFAGRREDAYRNRPGFAGPPRGLVTSGTAGVFHLRLDPRSHYGLLFTRRPFAHAEHLLSPADFERGVAPLRIVMRRGGRGRGLVVDEDGKAIAGATVELRLDSTTSGPGGAPPQRATVEVATGADGVYEIDGLVAGEASLAVRADGFVHTTRTVTIADPPDGSDLGEIALARAATLTGRVVDPEGLPTAGARIFSAANEPMAGMRISHSPAVATSDSEGRFTLGELRPGEALMLVATAPGFTRAELAGVEVPPTAPVELRLRPACRVRGTLTVRSRSPLAAGEVTLLAHRSAGGMSSSGLIQGTVEDDGAFTVDDVAPGTYTLMAGANGMRPARIAPIAVPPSCETAAVDVELEPGATLAGDIRLTTGEPVSRASVQVGEAAALARGYTDADGQFALSGLTPGEQLLRVDHPSFPDVTRTVHVEPGDNTIEVEIEPGTTISGRVVTADGAPAGAAMVTLAMGGARPARISTGTDGSFTLVGVARGTYQLMAWASGWTSPEPRELQVGDEPIAGLELVLGHGAALVGEIRGLPASALGELRVYASASGMASTNGVVTSSGSYRIEGLAPGDWKVRAMRRSSPLTATGQVSVGPDDREVRLDLEFIDGLTLTGRVLTTTRAVAGASITVLGTDGAGFHRVNTDRDGRFRVEGLVAGTYRLTVEDLATGLVHSREIGLDEGSEAEVEILLETARLAGRVVDGGDGGPLADARIELRPADDPIGRRTRGIGSDSRGVFAIAEVATGAWLLRVSRDGYASVERPLDLTADVTDLELRLEPNQGVTLRVRTADGSRPPMLQVVGIDGGGTASFAANATVDDEGRARLSTLPPGSWQLVITTWTMATAQVAATSPGPPVEVALERAGALDLRVPALADSAQLAQAVVRDPAGRVHSRPAGAGVLLDDWSVRDGIGHVFALPAGTWFVTVTAADGRTWTGQAVVAPGGTAEIVLE